jgi:hypothetical protein
MVPLCFSGIQSCPHVPKIRKVDLRFTTLIIRLCSLNTIRDTRSCFYSLRALQSVKRLFGTSTWFRNDGNPFLRINSIFFLDLARSWTSSATRALRFLRFTVISEDATRVHRRIKGWALFLPFSTSSQSRTRLVDTCLRVDIRKRRAFIILSNQFSFQGHCEHGKRTQWRSEDQLSSSEKRKEDSQLQGKSW